MQEYYLEEINWFCRGLCCMWNAVYAFPYQSIYWFGSYYFVVAGWL